MRYGKATFMTAEAINLSRTMHRKVQVRSEGPGVSGAVDVVITANVGEGRGGSTVRTSRRSTIVQRHRTAAFRARDKRAKERR